MFIVNLKRAMPTFTHSENRIATYLTDNLSAIDELSSYDLARKTGVGQSTIIRFSQKLGYKTFKDMVDDILEDDVDALKSSYIDANEGTVETVEKLKHGYEASLSDILRYNPVDIIEAITEKIYHAEKIFCFGAQSSNFFAGLFVNRLLEIGMEAYNTEDTFRAFSIIRKMKSTDVAFFVSSSGESEVTLRLARAAKKYGITVICITGLQDSTLKSLSDYYMCSDEYIVYTSLKSVTNRCSQLFLIDCLYLNLWKKASDRFNQNIAEVDDFTRKDFGGLSLLPDDSEENVNLEEKGKRGL